ncbi:MAG: hypothetical protein WBN18_12005 [Flavobacteriaceae bacterium]
MFPLFAMGLFVLLYFLAALNYPGGSWISPQQEGFSFWNNYLCDLLDEYAINGDLNTARYTARFALASLCFGLLVLWAYLPRLFPKKSKNLKLMQMTGILSLLVLVLLGSDRHDLIVRLAGFLGVIAFVSCFVELYKAGYARLLALGILSLIVFLINYYIYETGKYLNTLALIQKITFILFLGWFVLIDIAVYQEMKLGKP